MQELSQEALETFFNDMLNLFILPEFKRRKETGNLTDPFELRGAQVIFYSDGKKPEIRINSEIKAIGLMKLKKGISKNKGDPIYAHEVEGLDRLSLTDEEDPNCVHATIVSIANRWTISFDFRYNKALAKKHIITAKQFYELAQISFDKKYYAPCLDNLFSAAELASRTVLLLMPDPKFRKKTTHGDIQYKYNKFADIGNVDPSFAKHLTNFQA
jgi:hypothetical protein